MTKHIQAVLQGVRQSLQLAPRKPYIDPKAGGTSIDAGRLRADGLMIVRDVNKVLRLHGEQIKNGRQKD